MPAPVPPPAGEGLGWGLALIDHPGLQPVDGFESTGYAWLDGRIVWTRDDARIDHPRHLHRPWHAAPRAYHLERLQAAAQALIGKRRGDRAPGLLALCSGQPLPFPLEAARPRFEALVRALVDDDAAAFVQAAPRVLGLGPGLTPSGDDFLGGITFALAHAPRPGWRAPLQALRATLAQAAEAGATNPISAALLDDLMQGQAYRPLHELLDVLAESPTARGHTGRVDRALAAVFTIGASSGADLLAGLLIALASTPVTRPVAQPITASMAAPPASSPSPAFRTPSCATP